MNTLSRHEVLFGLVKKKKKDKISPIVACEFLHLEEEEHLFLKINLYTSFLQVKEDWLFSFILIIFLYTFFFSEFSVWRIKIGVFNQLLFSTFSWKALVDLSSTVWKCFSVWIPVCVEHA